MTDEDWMTPEERVPPKTWAVRTKRDMSAGEVHGYLGAIDSVLNHGDDGSRPARKRGLAKHEPRGMDPVRLPKIDRPFGHKAA